MLTCLTLLIITYLFGAISTVYRYVGFPYIHIFCQKTEKTAVFKKSLFVTLWFSSPYLFIVASGYYFFNSNIGGYCILGSEIYSYTLIPVLIVFFGKAPHNVDKWLWSRDMIFGVFANGVFYYCAKDETKGLEWLWPSIMMIPYIPYFFL